VALFRVWRSLLRQPRCVHRRLLPTFLLWTLGLPRLVVSSWWNAGGGSVAAAAVRATAAGLAALFANSASDTWLVYWDIVGLFAVSASLYARRWRLRAWLGAATATHICARARLPLAGRGVTFCVTPPHCYFIWRDAGLLRCLRQLQYLTRHCLYTHRATNSVPCRWLPAGCNLRRRDGMRRRFRALCWRRACSLRLVNDALENL